MASTPARIVHQRQRPKVHHENNSMRRIYDLLRFSLPRLEPEAALVEESLVVQCSASRNTVRAVLRCLADEGLIQRRPKVGTRVTGSMLLPVDQVMTVPELGHTTPFETNGIILEALTIPAPAIVAERLSLGAGAWVLVLEGLLYFDDLPMAIATSYLALDSPEQAEPVPTDPDPVAFLEGRLGVRLGPSTTTVGALTADAVTASWLAVPEGAAILWIEDVLTDDIGQPRALSQYRFRSDRIAVFASVNRRHTQPVTLPAIVEDPYVGDEPLSA
jgi:GntR family transcriptional regulator